MNDRDRLSALKYAIKSAETELHNLQGMLLVATALKQQMPDLQFWWEHPYGDDHREGYFESEHVLEVKHKAVVCSRRYDEYDITVCTVANMGDGLEVHSPKVKIGQVEKGGSESMMLAVGWRKRLSGLGYDASDLDKIESEIEGR